MCLADLALVALPKHQRIEKEKEDKNMLRLIRPRSLDDIILAAQIEDNKAKAAAAVKAFKQKKYAEAFKQKKYAESRILTQADIDKRLPNQIPEREITRRLKQIGA